MQQSVMSPLFTRGDACPGGGVCVGNGLLRGSTFGDGEGETRYEYDDGTRLTKIEHRSASSDAIAFEYAYDRRDLPTVLTEKGITPLSEQIRAIVDFAYDNRGRLVEEERVVFPEYGGAGPYHFRYEYDQGGNRTRKVDLLNEIEVVYEYDIDDIATYTANNRLMKYATNDISGGATTPLSTTWYYYNASGNVTRIVTSPEGSDEYSATLLSYGANGRAVSFVAGESWNGADIEGTYDIVYAREFRYDGARARYLNRELDPATLQSSGELLPVEGMWSDYDGDRVYGDYQVINGDLEAVASHEPGIGTFSWMAGSPDSVPEVASMEYYHGDLIGTTRHMSDRYGDAIDPVVYTGFGKRIDGPNHRYGYAGAWGYQSHDDFPYLHVGARYYDAASGRFLQRDPIGIRGALNLYSYVTNGPTSRVDPSGLCGTGRVVRTPWTTLIPE